MCLGRTRIATGRLRVHSEVMKFPLRLLVLTMAWAANSLAQSKPAPALPPESRQFDFWLGAWDVTTPDGKPVGTNTIEPIAGGAGLLENWTGYPAPGGGTGKSLNAYNAGKKQWQQFWVGSGGGVLELSGALLDGNMVLTGEHVVRGKPTTERITWTPNGDGSVRQLWEQSIDGGKTWTTAFDGKYVRK